MVASERVVAVGGEDQYATVTQSPAEELDEVQAGLVGPVHILEHQDGQTLGRLKLVAQQPEDRSAWQLLGPTDLGQLPTDLVGDVQQRGKWLRSE